MHVNTNSRKGTPGVTFNASEEQKVETFAAFLDKIAKHADEPISGVAKTAAVAVRDVGNFMKVQRAQMEERKKQLDRQRLLPCMEMTPPEQQTAPPPAEGTVVQDVGLNQPAAGGATDEPPFAPDVSPGTGEIIPPATPPEDATRPANGKETNGRRGKRGAKAHA